MFKLLSLLPTGVYSASSSAGVAILALFTASLFPVQSELLKSSPFLAVIHSVRIGGHGRMRLMPGGVASEMGAH